MKVIFTRRAHAQAKRKDAWWRENRSASPDLFWDELTEATRRLGVMSEMGAVYAVIDGAPVHRLLLRGTQNHVYYEVDRDADTLWIVSVWGTPKGEGPKL